MSEKIRSLDGAGVDVLYIEIEGDKSLFAHTTYRVVELQEKVETQLRSVRQITQNERDQLLGEGVDCQYLERGEPDWRKGKLRVRLQLEFVSEEPEAENPIELEPQELEAESSIELEPQESEAESSIEFAEEPEAENSIEFSPAEIWQTLNDANSIDDSNASHSDSVWGETSDLSVDHITVLASGGTNGMSDL